MKKAFPAIFFVLVVGILAWYFTSGPGGSNLNKSGTSTTSSTNTTTSSSNTTETGRNSDPVSIGNSTTTNTGTTSVVDSEGLDDEEIKPATELYKSADEALAAIRAAAKNFDDIILEQFNNPGPNCSWCDSLYASVHELMFSTETTQDEKSYFAEILAVSGKVDNVRALVDAIRNSTKPEDGDVFAEALELASGKDDITSYLGSQLNGASDQLRESIVAALSNQNSRLAAETLYKHTIERSDADGYYSQGIGLGEFIPDEEAIPYLQELMLKRDQYSHLAVKALLNGGADGLRTVLDTLENSKDSEFDKKMIKDVVEHVTFDDNVEALLKARKDTAKQSVSKEFIEQALKGFASEGTTELDTGDLDTGDTEAEDKEP
jgi:hypothetical protein